MPRPRWWNRLAGSPAQVGILRDNVIIVKVDVGVLGAYKRPDPQLKWLDSARVAGIWDRKSLTCAWYVPGMADVYEIKYLRGFACTVSCQSDALSEH